MEHSLELFPGYEPNPTCNSPYLTHSLSLSSILSLLCSSSFSPFLFLFLSFSLCLSLSLSLILYIFLLLLSLHLYSNCRLICAIILVLCSPNLSVCMFKMVRITRPLHCDCYSCRYLCSLPCMLITHINPSLSPNPTPRKHSVFSFFLSLPFFCFL